MYIREFIVRWTGDKQCSDLIEHMLIDVLEFGKIDERHPGSDMEAESARLAAAVLNLQEFENSYPLHSRLLAGKWLANCLLAHQEMYMQASNLRWQPVITSLASLAALLHTDVVVQRAIQVYGLTGEPYSLKKVCLISNYAVTACLWQAFDVPVGVRSAKVFAALLQNTSRLTDKDADAAQGLIDRNRQEDSPEFLLTLAHLHRAAGNQDMYRQLMQRSVLSIEGATRTYIFQLLNYNTWRHYMKDQTVESLMSAIKLAETVRPWISSLREDIDSADKLRDFVQEACSNQFEVLLPVTFLLANPNDYVNLYYAWKKSGRGYKVADYMQRVPARVTAKINEDANKIKR